MDELATGIHRWTAPHPEWRPKSYEEVFDALSLVLQSHRP